MTNLKTIFYQKIGKRLFDLIVACLALLIFYPLLLLVAILVKLTSSGPIFFISKRMGREGKSFGLLKFRTMRSNIVEESKQFTPGDTNRVTFIGSILRKSKIDEMPGLLNVIKGDMSLVGPRPEAPRYAKLFTGDNSCILSVKPGITDPASIEFRNEEQLLKTRLNPEIYYIDKILPQKQIMNKKYIHSISFKKDIQIILTTIRVVLIKYR